jgi:hypothetical protein
MTKLANIHLKVAGSYRAWWLQMFLRKGSSMGTTKSTKRDTLDKVVAVDAAQDTDMDVGVAVEKAVMTTAERETAMEVTHTAAYAEKAKKEPGVAMVERAMTHLKGDLLIVWSATIVTGKDIMHGTARAQMPRQMPCRRVTES